MVRVWIKTALIGARDFAFAVAFVGGLAGVSGFAGGEAYALQSHTHPVCYSSTVSPGSSSSGAVSAVQTLSFPSATVALLSLSGHRYLVRESGSLLLYPGERISLRWVRYGRWRVVTSLATGGGG